MIVKGDSSTLGIMSSRRANYIRRRRGSSKSEAVRCLLSRVSSWDFNVFTLDKVCNGRSLLCLTMHLLWEHKLIQHFKLDPARLMQCLYSIEIGYHSNNPYHNGLHAADVTQAMHCFLMEKKLRPHLKPIEILGALLASVAHDLDHPGVNQAFLIATANPLAALYNNNSVLENHHYRSALGIIRESGVFDHFTGSQWRQLEGLITSLILATDMSLQQKYLARFKAHNEAGDLNLQGNASHRSFALQIALKCADICNPCRNWDMCKVWAERVCSEFFRQGDLERRLGLQVTPMCDRHASKIAAIQVGFAENVVDPLFREWSKFSPSVLSSTMRSVLESNIQEWKRRKSQPSDEDENETDSVGELKTQGEEDSDLDDINEDESLPFLQQLRRHSFPAIGIQMELTRLYVRRSSFPRVEMNASNPGLAGGQGRRCSLPLPPTTALDRASPISHKNGSSRSLSIETLLGGPKLTSLAPSLELARILDTLTGDGHGGNTTSATFGNRLLVGCRELDEVPPSPPGSADDETEEISIPCPSLPNAGTSSTTSVPE